MSIENTALELIAEPRRRAMLHMVWDEERSAGEIAAAMPDVTFGAVSQHLKLLREGGLVTLRKQGRQRFYRAAPKRLGPLAEYLKQLWNNRLGDLVDAAEQAQKDKEHDHDDNHS